MADRKNVQVLGKAVGLQYISPPGCNYDGNRHILVSTTGVYPQFLKGEGNADLVVSEYGLSVNGEGDNLRTESHIICESTNDKNAAKNCHSIIRIDCLLLRELKDLITFNEEEFISGFQSVVSYVSSNVPKIHFINSESDAQSLASLLNTDSKTPKDIKKIPGRNGIDGGLKDVGKGLALLYYVQCLKPILQGMKKRVEDPRFPHLLEFVVVDCSQNAVKERSYRVDCRLVGWIGMTFATDNSVDRNGIPIEVFSINCQNSETCHVIINKPDALLTLKMAKDEGMLSESEYKTELLTFIKTLEDSLRKYEENQFTIFDGSIQLRTHILENISRNRNASGSTFYNNDLETDGGIECDTIMDSVVTPENTPKHSVSLEESFESFPGFVTTDVVILSEGSELLDDCTWSLSPSFDSDVGMDVVDDLLLTSNMVLAALKQENYISDETRRKLTAEGRMTSLLKRSGIILKLFLSIVVLNSARYSELVQSTEGLRQRKKHFKNQAAVKNTEGGNCNSKVATMAEVVPEKETQFSDKNKKPDKHTVKGAVDVKSSKIQIISNVLFSMIEDKKHLPFDFEIQLRKLVFDNKHDASKLRNSDSLSLLHAVVINNRPQFLLPLFRVGCWGTIYRLKVEKGEYEGKTADDLCTLMKLRKIQKEMDTYIPWEKSLNPIHIAARSGDSNEIKKLLKYSQDIPFEPDSMGCTTLYWAVVGGNVDAVRQLLNLKVDHTKVNNRKESLVHVACMIGHTHLLSILVKELQLDVTVKDAAKKSALLRIAENGDEKSLAKLMKLGVKTEQLKPILAIAGHYGRLAFIKKVIEEYRVDPGSKDDAGKTAFMRACEQSRTEVARYLITQGIDISETDVRRRNVVHMAADGGTTEIMKFLIEALNSKGVLKNMINQRDKYIGAELCMLIRGKDKGRDSWHYVEVSRGLMDIFMKRTKSGTIDVAKYGTLLHSGWGVDPDEDSAQEIERRFETRRNATMAEDYDMTPLHIAIFKDKEDVAELLMDNGSDVNSRDKFGLTPMHIAAMRGNLSLVRSMMSRGAATDMLDNLVKTPVDVAEDNEHKNVATFMKSFQYIPMAQNFSEKILPTIQALVSEETIQQLLRNGGDLRTHLINSLRDLTIDINETLLALGSGPVLEESSVQGSEN